MYSIFVPIPLIPEEEFIIKVDDEVMLNYIGFIRREVKVIRFYVVLQPIDDGAIRVQERQIFYLKIMETMMQIFYLKIMTTELTMPSIDGEGGERILNYQ